ncbi:MAG: citrate transporter, partial [Ignavibacteria bacterium]|nr:citrate transporter [Ignavibacteria bacterium]
MTVGLIILVVFLVAAILMFLRKLPALLALPLMAIAIAAIEVLTGKLSVQDLMQCVIADGAIRLADPIVISMFGGMLSILMQKTGVAESFVRRGAELAGDNPWVVTVIMLFIITLLFTTIGGLGAVIMVGTI